MPTSIDQLLERFADRVADGTISRRQMLLAIAAAAAFPAIGIAQGGGGRGAAADSGRVAVEADAAARRATRRRSCRPSSRRAGRPCGSTTSTISAPTTRRPRRSTRRSWDGRCGATTASSACSTSARTRAASSFAADSPRRRPPRSPTRDSASTRPPVQAVFDGFAWGITPWDTDKVKAELEKRGLNPVADHRGSDYKSFRVKDPDGFDVAITNGTKALRRKTPANGKLPAPAPFEPTGWNTLYLDHISFEVPDYPPQRRVLSGAARLGRCGPAAAVRSTVQIGDDRAARSFVATPRRALRRWRRRWRRFGRRRGAPAAASRRRTA